MSKYEEQLKADIALALYEGEKVRNCRCKESFAMMSQICAWCKLQTRFDEQYCENMGAYEIN